VDLPETTPRSTGTYVFSFFASTRPPWGPMMPAQNAQPMPERDWRLPGAQTREEDDL
jgi:hypothetical protein